LKILVHDFAGHPFTAELSRSLAARGHNVTHVWFSGDTGPKGRLSLLEDDAETLSFLPLGAKIDYSKTNFVKRRQGDIAYGREVAEVIARTRPDIVLSGNTPTEAQEPIVAACRKAAVPFIYWCQDFYSIAASRLLEAKLPVAGHLIGAYYRFLERRQMHRSARVLHITDSFRAQTDAWGIPAAQVEVIPNWGALDEIPLTPRDTPWARAHGLSDQARFVYSGTLAMKHNPAFLSGLAAELAAGEQLVLVSNGVGVDHLQQESTQKDLKALKILPLQPIADLPSILGAGDVLLAVIEREAGIYSVPSKILSYLCAGRPIVLAAPADNLAAQILTQTGAGKVVEPEDIAGFIKAALSYRDDPEGAAKAGAAGREYAEAHFQMDRVCDRFEALFDAARKG